MSNTEKTLTRKDDEQTLRAAYNDVDASLSMSGFLTGKIGRKIELAISTTNVANDTETYTYSENGTILYEIEIVYTDGTRALMLSSERIA